MQYSLRLLILITLVVITDIIPVLGDEHRIVVITDPHVMAEELLVRDGKAFQKYLSSTKRLVNYSQAIFDKVVDNVISMSPKPELFLILGDISNEGELVSHYYVKDRLDYLKSFGIASLVIPGNHDWGKREKAQYYDFDTTKVAQTCVRFGIELENSLETIYSDYGFKSFYKTNTKGNVEVERESVSSTLTYACEPIANLVIIGIDSGNREYGMMSEKTLEWVCSKAQEASLEGKDVIVMMHHPLISHNSRSSQVIYPSRKEDNGSGYEIVRNQLADTGVKAVFTGHVHINDIVKDWNSDFTHSIFDISTGCLCSYPCYYRLVTYNDVSHDISIASLRVTNLDNSPNSLSDISKFQFTKKSMVNSVKKRLILAGIPKDSVSIVAPYLVQACVFHAEGDERKNAEAQKLLSKLRILLKNSPSYVDYVNSMLLDLSNFGNAARENQTDDGKLIINLRQ